MMEDRKLTKEDIDRVRGIEGFPIAKDEDIIALSRPPYYTACPNPFIADFIIEHGTPYDETTDDYHREPFASDVAEDKHDLIYNIHSYHTKVPPKAIKSYIEHYTEPGDIVLDSFCGTGMTGIGAKICDDKGLGVSQRHAVMIDLSTIAAFVAGSYNKPIEFSDIEEIKKKIQKLEEVFQIYYLTEHVQNGEIVTGFSGSPVLGEINYTVWSDVFVCPSCTSELVYYDVAVDSATNKTRKEFVCPHCGSKLTKAMCERAIEVANDPVSGKPFNITKSTPVLINYSVGKTRYTKKPDEKDIGKTLSPEVIYKKLPNAMSKFSAGDKTAEMFRGNLTYIWQIYRIRTLSAIQQYLNSEISEKSLFLLTSTLPKLTILNRFMPEHGSRALVGPMAGTFYLPAMSVENNVIRQLKFQFKKLQNLRYEKTPSIVSTQSATSLHQIPDNSIDYIFIDPPFGANIMYSELNVLSESWLKVFTNNNVEAIMNDTQKKGLVEYQNLMVSAFSELHRVLKPNRWITIEFHNSRNSVWNVIQEAINYTGFIIADVRTLNKEKKTINQFNARGTVDQDLVISAYKPKESFVRQFTERAGDPEMAWEFVRQYLQNLAIAPDSTGKIEVVSERQDYLLFDRMVAFHIMNGIPVPMDATTFYAGLRERFILRDGMFFLADQVNEYDERRQKMELQDQQLSLFISDEKSAIMWLNVQLTQARQSYSDIQPKYLQELHQAKFEQIPELLDMLKENFLQDDDGKWYVPDLSDKADLEKLRRKRLLKDFSDIYAKGTGRIKNARTEAIRVGFDECWKERNYSLIVKVGDRLPETVLQEDPALLMYYDNAASRM